MLRLAAGAPKANHQQRWASARNLAHLLLLIAVVLVLRWSVASPYNVPTPSMEPTIKVGDRLLALRLAYGLRLPFSEHEIMRWGEPQRGDIVVFKYPLRPDVDYVKRVVAIGGDEVQIQDDVLYINGQPQAKEAASAPDLLQDLHENREAKQLFREHLDGRPHWLLLNVPAAKIYTKAHWPGIGQAPHKVPAGSIFCLGDNRDNSTDSRTWSDIPLSYVHGKAVMVIWSLYTPRGSAWPRLRWERFGTLLR